MAVRTAESPYTCGWTTDGECCSKLEAAFTSNDPAQVALAQRCLNAAAEILYALSGRQFGLCESVIRPCRRQCCDGCIDGSLRWTPVLSGGQWYNVSCSSCKDSCSCPQVCEMRLPGNVHSISEIKIDGVVLDESKYRVDRRKMLVRTEEGECWPICQDMRAASTQPNTWEITYLHGKPVPEGGRAALAELACELCLGCLGDECCKLPNRITNVDREGVSFTLLDPMAFLDMGKTGLYMVDLWLKAVNPRARSRGAAITSPDVVRQRKTTWP